MKKKEIVVAVAAAVLAAAGGDECVKASAFGWNAEDATKCLQAAVDSGARKVVIDRQADDWVVGPIFLRTSGQEVVVADGVTVRAKKGEFKGRGDCLFRIAGTNRNVTLRGEGKATLKMNKRDYQNPAEYSWSEWRHTVSVYGSGATVRDLTILSSGGDGVYVAGNAKDVTLENLVCRDHHRQGISVIGAIGLRVRRCRFDETGGTAPQCGVDVEPNRDRDRLEDIVFEDCTFDGNAASGIDLHLPMLTDRTPPISLTFRRCIARGNRHFGITVFASRSRDRAVKGTLRFEDCSVSGGGAGALRIVNQRPGALDISFSGCTFDARGVSGSPILFGNGDMPSDFGGVTFERSRMVADVPAEKAAAYVGIAGTGIAPDGVKGELLFASADGQAAPLDWAGFARRNPSDPARLALLLSFRTMDVDWRTVCAPADAQPLATPASTGWLRGTFTFVQWLPAAGDYPVVFRTRRIGKKRGAGARVQVRDAAGTDLGLFSVGDCEAVTNVIHVMSPGLRRFEVMQNFGLLEVESRWPGHGILADTAVHLFGGRRRNFFFTVPADTEDVAVQVSPEEPCSARLVRPDGTVAQEMPYGSHGTSVLSAKRAPGSGEETWCIEFPRVDEDMRFRIGAPALPLVAPAKGAALVQKGKGK